MAKARKKEKRVVPHAVAHVNATFNNTLVCISGSGRQRSDLVVVGPKLASRDPERAPLSLPRWLRRMPDYQAQVTYGVRSVDVEVNGSRWRTRVRSPRPSVRRYFGIKSIKDVTPIPHNGCRPSQAAPGLIPASGPRYRTETSTFQPETQ